jgi:hypothetical protein
MEIFNHILKENVNHKLQNCCAAAKTRKPSKFARACSALAHNGAPFVGRGLLANGSLRWELKISGTV